MTPEQREYLERIARHDVGPRVVADAIAAALADLDACRAALAPVARELRWTADKPTFYGPEYHLTLDHAEVAAVLAAAGEERS